MSLDEYLRTAYRCGWQITRAGHIAAPGGILRSTEVSMPLAEVFALNED